MSTAVKPMTKDSLIHFDRHWEAIQIAWEARSAVLMYGIKGHAKSIAATIFRDELIKRGELTLDQVAEKTFHAAMTDAELLGGLNWKKFKDPDDPSYEFHLEKSVFNRRFNIWEEFGDAPIQTMALVKDIMTSGQFRQGLTNFQVATEFYMAMTNKQPSEISALGDSYDAILDRFPYILKIDWPSYDAADYMEMFQRSRAVYTQTEIVARMAALATAEGHFVSPRTAWIANEHSKIIGNLTPLSFIQGFMAVYEKIKIMEAERQAVQVFRDAMDGLKAIMDLKDGSAAEMKAKGKKLKSAADSLGKLKMVNAIVQERDEAVAQINLEINRLMQKAFDI